MMCKKTGLLLGLCLLFLFSGRLGARAAEELPTGADILLIFGSGLTDTEKENVRIFSDMALCLGKSINFGSDREYAGHLEQYEYVICYDLGEISAEFMTELSQYDGKLFLLGTGPAGELLESRGISVQTEPFDAVGTAAYIFSTEDSFETIGTAAQKVYAETYEYESGSFTVKGSEEPLFFGWGRMRVCTLSDYQPKLLQAALMKELSEWLWIYEDSPADYSQYLVIDELYPFMPLAKLQERVEMCVDSGLPFVLSVMPIYFNQNYPAMQEFCEVLKYAQNHGGAVILHAPIIHGQKEDIELLNERLTIAMEAYTDLGVYPLGIEIPRSWTYEEDRLQTLKRFSTVFIYEDNEGTSFDLKTHQNLLYENKSRLIWPALALDKTGVSYLKACSSAVYVNAAEDVTVLSDCLASLKKSFVPVSGLMNMNHAVWGNDFYLKYEDSDMIVNQELRSFYEETAETQEAYNYKRNTLDRVTVSLENQNRGLIVLVAVVSIVFLTFIVFARVRNRRSFFYSENEKDEDEK